MTLKQHLKTAAINVVVIALAIAIGMPLGSILIKQFRPASAPPGPIALADDKANLVFKNTSTDLVLFATTTCGFCKAGIELLDKSGANYKVYYIDKDVHAEKIYEALKTEGVPVLLSKQQYIIGFKKEVWTRFIGKANSKSASVATKAL